jgi:hypothetical protein
LKVIWVPGRLAPMGLRKVEWRLCVYGYDALAVRKPVGRRGKAKLTPRKLPEALDLPPTEW